MLTPQQRVLAPLERDFVRSEYHYLDQNNIDAEGCSQLSKTNWLNLQIIGLSKNLSIFRL